MVRPCSLLPAVFHVFWLVRCFPPGGVPYCFLLPELAVPNKPFVTKNSFASKIMWQALKTVSSQEGQEAWSTFFLNAELVPKFLAEVAPSDVEAVIQTGLNFPGTGWTASKAALQVRKLTGLSLLSSDLTDYLTPFLASVAMAKGVDGPLGQLDDHSGEICFRLAEVWTGSKSDKSQAKKPATEDAAEEESPDEPVVRFDWEPEEVPLPADLQVILNRAQEGEKM